MMKAVLIDKFGGAEALRIGEMERPMPGNGQVLVEVAASTPPRFISVGP